MPAAQPATSELSVQQLNHHFLLASYWLLSCYSAVDVVFDFSDALLAADVPHTRVVASFVSERRIEHPVWRWLRSHPTGRAGATYRACTLSPAWSCPGASGLKVERESAGQD